MTKESWHLNKSVPVTLLFAIVIQAAAIVAAGTAMRGDIDVNVLAIAKTDQRLEAVKDAFEAKNTRLEATINAQAIALARIEESLKNIHARLNEIINRRRPQ